jgi:hypothetical protein
MIKVCLADNYPVVHFERTHFKDHAEISLVANVGNLMIRDILQTKDIDA